MAGEITTPGSIDGSDLKLKLGDYGSQRIILLLVEYYLIII